MSSLHEIESFRFLKATHRLLRPTTEFLEELYRSDFSDNLKLEILLSIGKIRDPKSLPVLTHAFDVYAEHIEPITALGSFKDSSPVPKLIQRLEDPDALYKEEIVRVIGEIGDPMATRTLIELLHDEDRMVRYFSARALYKMGGRDVVQSLCGLLNDPDEWIVINVLEILSQMRDPEAVPALVGQYEIVRDSRLKAIIISSLAPFAEGRLLKTFENGLASYDPRIQANSVEAISMLKISPLEMRRKLKKFYGHPNNRVRANTCIALAVSDPESVLNEIKAMIESTDASTRRSAAYVLARIDLPGRDGFIRQLLTDEYFGVRKMALKAAIELESALCVTVITPLLKDENQWVRRQAVDCAAIIDDFPDEAILELLKIEESPPVIEPILKFVVKRNLQDAVELIYDRIRKEPDEEIGWLIAALGHLGAREELGKAKKNLSAVRSEVFGEYYQALLLNGELEVFTELEESLKGKKRENEILFWVKIIGAIGDFIQKVDEYSTAFLDALRIEVQKDMAGIVTFDSPAIEEPEKNINAGIELYRKKDYAKARAFFKDFLAGMPQHADARYYYAASCYYLGKTATAREYLEKLTAEIPSHVDAAILMGQIYFRRKQWQKLASCYESVSQFVPAEDRKNTIRVYGALGLAYYHQTRYREAIGALNKGLEANPRDLSSSYHLALCYYALGESEKARDILQKLRKTLPSDSKVLKNVIELLQRI